MSEGDKSLFQHLVIICIYVQANYKEEDADAEEKRRKEMESAIKANIEKAQKKQKEYYDSKHVIGDTFTIGL